MLDNRYDFVSTEKKWQDYWNKNNIYKFAPEKGQQIYSIDTPPPTVSGKLHVGHLSSYTHIEIVARHHRMKGEAVYFPFGFDDNGLPTERYVEKKNKIKAHEMKRGQFIDLCLKESAEMEKEFYTLYRSAGYSCNLDNTYSSISKNTQKISQESFIDLLNKGHIYNAKAPALWCTECRTAVAQSELDNAEVAGTFNHIKFFIEGTKEHIIVATTRPEMLPACVCVFVNPQDKKNARLLNKKLVVPHFNFAVPVYADDLVDTNKGSGIVMCCTFGDNVDKEWQRKYNLPIKEAFDASGRMTALAGEFAGLHITEARAAIIQKLKEEDLLIKQESITHAVSVHERCGNPIEIIVKKQWFIDILNKKQQLYQAGLDLNWHPENMRARYLNWVENLQWNWCISRQRFFGVPFPVWFCKNCGEAVTADIKDLPVDPATDKPRKKCKCGCSDFVPETDVMDTWATSSLTPQICYDLITKKGLDGSMLPMSLRPNAHDNIRVWDFYTIIKSLYHFNKLPWKDLMISGYLTAGDGQKLAKSKGNASASPQEIITKYSADVMRYWAGGLSLGRDTAFAFDAFESGRKLQNKIWNAARFVLSFLDGYVPEKIKLLPIDNWLMAKFNKMQAKFIKAMDNYEIAFALSELEKFFWDFCDNYIEIVKDRLYKPEVHGEDAKKSGQYASYSVLLGLLKLFSIFMPHITEEIYMNAYASQENFPSLHISKYLPAVKFDEAVIEKGNAVVDIITQVRKKKSVQQVAMKTRVKMIAVTAKDLDFIKACEGDIKALCNIETIIYKTGEFGVEVGEFVKE